MLKKNLKRTRDKVFKSTNDAIDILEEKTENLNKKIDSIQTSLLQINHYQVATYNELTEKVRNSGTINTSSTELVAKIFTGQKIYLDPRDISVTPHLALDAIWEANITLAWLKVLKPNEYVFDIGANFGYYGLIAAQSIDKTKGKVVLFEANPNLIPYVNKTLSVNWIHEVAFLENLAIADRSQDLELNIMKDYIGSSSVLSAEHMDAYMHGKMNAKTEQIVKVKAVSLDEYCKTKKIEKLGLIKMDIEGYEDVAYKGMREIIRKSPDVTMFIEFTKDSYREPETFYNQLLSDFGSVYVIDAKGNITKPKHNDYESIVGYSHDWVMPIFSKNKYLHNN